MVSKNVIQSTNFEKKTSCMDFNTFGTLFHFISMNLLKYPPHTCTETLLSITVGNTAELDKIPRILEMED